MAQVLPKMAAGQRYGRLTTIERVGKTAANDAIWSYLCDCGNQLTARSSSARNGNTKSCGCLYLEMASAMGKAAAKHGMSRSLEYKIWNQMTRRCNDPKNKNYPTYGGRGIKVCDRWNDFKVFYSDMGPKPSPNHSLDRIDNNGIYEPSNCRWATQQEQTLNRRKVGALQRFTIVELLLELASRGE